MEIVGATANSTPFKGDLLKSWSQLNPSIQQADESSASAVQIDMP